MPSNCWIWNIVKSFFALSLHSLSHFVYFFARFLQPVVISVFLSVFFCLLSSFEPFSRFFQAHGLSEMQQWKKVFKRFSTLNSQPYYLFKMCFIYKKCYKMINDAVVRFISTVLLIFYTKRNRNMAISFTHIRWFENDCYEFLVLQMKWLAIKN